MRKSVSRFLRPHKFARLIVIVPLDGVPSLAAASRRQQTAAQRFSSAQREKETPVSHIPAVSLSRDHLRRGSRTSNVEGPMDADSIYSLLFSSSHLGGKCKGKQQQRGFGSTSCARTGTIDFPIYGGRCSISREIESSLASYLRPPRSCG